MAISKAFSYGIVVALSGSSALAQSQADAPPTPLKNAAVAGTFAAIAAKVSIDQFLDSGEFTAHDKEIFLRSQTFANEAWRKAVDFPEAVAQLRNGQIGAVRIQIHGMSDQKAFELVRSQYQEAADRYKESAHPRAVEMNDIKNILETTDYPLHPMVRERLLEYADKYHMMSEEQVEALGHYIDNRHAVLALDKGRASMNTPQTFKLQIAALKKDMMLVFTGAATETPENIFKVLGGRSIDSVETMSVRAYATTIRDVKLTGAIVPTESARQVRRKIGGSVAGVAAFVLGGFAFNELIEAAKSVEQRWAPKQIDVKK